MSRRIAIIGNAGGGKSTLARQLGQVTGLPVYHLDNLLWQPGWQRLPEAAFDREHDALIAQPAWIIDGVAYAPTLERRLALLQAYEGEKEITVIRRKKALAVYLAQQS